MTEPDLCGDRLPLASWGDGPVRDLAVVCQHSQSHQTDHEWTGIADGANVYISWVRGRG